MLNLTNIVRLTKMPTSWVLYVCRKSNIKNNAALKIYGLSATFVFWVVVVSVFIFLILYFLLRGGGNCGIYKSSYNISNISYLNSTPSIIIL
jgi:hypothetical protein